MAKFYDQLTFSKRFWEYQGVYSYKKEHQRSALIAKSTRQLC